jgi:hypothetical protein
MAGLSGAAYVVEMEQPFAVGQAGLASVRVGKDRPGLVRGLGGRWRKQDRTRHIADLRLDSTNAERTTWSLAVPENAGKSTETETANTNSSGEVFRPTWFMEQVSRYWEETDDPAERTNNKTVTTMCEEPIDQAARTRGGDRPLTLLSAAAKSGDSSPRTRWSPRVRRRRSTGQLSAATEY